ncbi:glycosyltransferase family 4 protein [Flavobacterium okayamense]|uniref:Colanic acid biosynthesis glycosyltransferase WcaI n=1 Tax=Flavobacterium okayamense TaxID=2830782 RepID=A0ABN6HTT7_9FLAO|nr:glycosyltransferase family 4 protein [Flavobacterium okayamense]BCY27832.1 colanic acid biosynthesis glycosyltransferase WcaI [Flavobacterium okayamense]
MSKKITIITANYYPEDTAIGLYTTQFADYLKSNGFEVTVLTGFPYYPQWEINTDYKEKKAFYTETNNEIKIIRFKQFVPKKVNLLGRILMILSFNFGLFINLFKLKKSDLIISVVPYTTNSIIGKFYSYFNKTKFWIHIQDFEFDLLIDSGIGTKNSFFKSLFFKILLKTESLLLNSADIISSISTSMIQKIYEKSNPKEVFYFPNWVSIDNINPTTSQHHPYFNSNKYNLLYSGNIGEKQDWDFFIEFCKLIKPEDDLNITIVGNGGYYNTLRERASNFEFVKFKDVVPYSDLSNLLCTADCHFLFQKSDVIDSVMPSKLLGMMASAKPSIITGNKNSEVNNILSNSSGGYYIASNNVKEVYEKVISLKNNAEKSSNMGAQAREFVKNNFSDKAVLDSFIVKINDVLHEER